MSENVDPRISLANERTFLAWIRTALGLMAAGIITAEVLGQDDGMRFVGPALILFGALTALLSYRRWQRNEQRFAAGLPLDRSPLPGLITALMTVVAAIGIVLALWARG